MNTYDEIYQEIRPIEIKVLSGKATKEEITKYCEFLESDINKKQTEKNLEAIRAAPWDYCAYTYYVSVNG